jgi:xanthine/uracil/vitamin C permease (AzgA family)
MYGPRPWTTGHLASAYLALGALAAIFNMRIKARFAAEAWLAFSLFYIPFCVGVGDSLGTMNGSATTATIVTDRANIPGRILRVTSAYIMVFNGKSISVLPLSKVLRIDRLFDASPERDYLAPFGVDDPAQN